MANRKRQKKSRPVRPAKAKPRAVKKAAPRSARPRAGSSVAGGIARRQSALLRLSSAIASATTEQEICDSVVNGLQDEALGYTFLGVFLLDDATGDRVMVASVGWKAAKPGFRVSPG